VDLSIQRLATGALGLHLLLLHTDRHKSRRGPVPADSRRLTKHQVLAGTVCCSVVTGCGLSAVSACTRTWNGAGSRTRTVDPLITKGMHRRIRDLSLRWGNPLPSRDKARLAATVRNRKSLVSEALMRQSVEHSARTLSARTRAEGRSNVEFRRISLQAIAHGVSITCPQKTPLGSSLLRTCLP
jgi:hypothetical protein